MMTLTDLFDRMAAADELSAATPGLAAVALAERTEDTTPWYLHLLVGIGSWIAALLLLVACSVAGWLDGGVSSLVFGLIICGVAVGLRAALAQWSVFTQAPLALALTGALVALTGLQSIASEFFKADSDATFAQALVGLVLLELVMIAVYRDQLHRFIATVAICLALCGVPLLYDLPVPADLLAVALGWAVALVWEHEALLARRDALTRPIAYGLTLGLLGVIWILLLADDSLDWLASVGLAAALAYQAWRLMAAAPLRLRAAAVASVALLLPFTLSAPGLLAAPLVMVVGFSRGNRAVVALGALFLASFLVFFYYNLDLTLLAKSFVLLGSGAVLLGAWAVVRRAARSLQR